MSTTAYRAEVTTPAGVTIEARIWLPEDQSYPDQDELHEVVQAGVLRMSSLIRLGKPAAIPGDASCPAVYYFEPTFAEAAQGVDEERVECRRTVNHDGPHEGYGKGDHVRVWNTSGLVDPWADEPSPPRPSVLEGRPIADVPQA